MKLRTLLGDIWATFRMIRRARRLQARLPRPRVTSWGERWAIDFQLDGKPQTWFTDSYVQAQAFASNLEKYGAENAESAA